MLKLIPVLLLFLVAIVAITLNKAYREIPAVELKRRARGHDEVATKLYGVVVYEKELSFFLWVVAILTASGGLVILTRSLNFWVAFIVVFVILWFSFNLLPYMSIPAANYLAVRFSRPLAWVIEHMRVVLSKLTVAFGISGPPSKLYQIDDMLDLLSKQSQEDDNHIPKERLEMAGRALTFGDILVKDIMVPRRSVVMVSSSDSIGPVLMGELHESGHSRFPVYQGNEDKIVGMLYMKDIINAKKGGSVKSFMKDEVYYAHESSTLEKTLHAFLKTKHHLFMVVNKFEEIVGIITIEDIIEEIIGRQIIDESDHEEDLRAEAINLAKKEHTEKTTEVIE